MALGALVHAVSDAQSYAEAEAALGVWLAHPQGAASGNFLHAQLEQILVPLVAYYAGLPRVTPEWYWRDCRLRLSRGRKHGADRRLERAALVWAIYHDFAPAQ